MADRLSCIRYEERTPGRGLRREPPKLPLAGEGWKARLTFRHCAFRFRMTSRLDMPIQVRNRVREMRAERGWTQQDLAEQVGVSRQSINSIENGRYVPSLPLALTFARVFRCSTDTIFTLEKTR